MNLITFPTFADVHVHLRQPGATQKEDFNTGTMAAVAGGYTQVLDMPNNIPPTISLQDIEYKERLAKGKIWCDLGFNFGASIDSVKEFLKVKNKVFALKLYMNQTTGTLLVESEKDRDLIFQNWNNQQPIMVHAEGETIDVAIKYAKKYQIKIHVCHIHPSQLASINKAKKAGLSISCEVSPHHLFLSKGIIKQLGSFAVMKPPLLTVKEQGMLWKHLEEIDMIATDHAPHTINEKLDQTSPKYGVPGLETTLPLMLWAQSKGMVSRKRIVEMLAINPRKIFNLPVQENTYMEIDLSKKYKIGDKKLYTKCNWTPFKHMEGVGEIKKVVLRGKSLFENGRFLNKPPGKIMYPNS